MSKIDSIENDIPQMKQLASEIQEKYVQEAQSQLEALIKGFESSPSSLEPRMMDYFNQQFLVLQIAVAKYINDPAIVSATTKTFQDFVARYDKLVKSVDLGAANIEQSRNVAARK